MGEIANDILCGFQCQWCGICFDGEHGYPVLCASCYVDYKDEENLTSKQMKGKGWQQATIKEL